MISRAPKSWRVHESLTLGAKEYLRAKIAKGKLDNFHSIVYSPPSVSLSLVTSMCQNESTLQI